MLDAGSLLPQRVVTSTAPWAPENRASSPSRSWQVGGRSPVATFGGKNCSGLLAASLQGACAHLECEYLAHFRVYQLVMPTLSLPDLLATSSHMRTVGNKA